MNKINPNHIISAFCNPIDFEKVESYTQTFQNEMLSHSFPPIQGFESVIDEFDVENTDLYFMNGEKVESEHLGLKIWKVTDGHHRTIAAINAELPYLETVRDYSTITNENELY